MLFQYYGGYRGGGAWSSALYWLDSWGVRDVILPFILIFTIFFAVLNKINIFGDKGKRFNIVISLVISLLVVIPHSTGAYPPQYDVVSIINNALPEVALLVVVVMLLLMMIGLGFGKAQTFKFIPLLASLALIYIFISAIRPMPIISRIDPGIQALIIIILIFGLVVWFVTKPPAEEGKGIGKWIKDLFEKIDYEQ